MSSEAKLPTFRIGFYVVVDAEGVDDIDAIDRAVRNLDWRPRLAVETQGVVRFEALHVHACSVEGDQ